MLQAQDSTSTPSSFLAPSSQKWMIFLSCFWPKFASQLKKGLSHMFQVRVETLYSLFRDSLDRFSNCSLIYTWRLNKIHLNRFFQHHLRQSLSTFAWSWRDRFCPKRGEFKFWTHRHVLDVFLVIAKIVVSRAWIHCLIKNWYWFAVLSTVTDSQPFLGGFLEIRC